MVDPIIFEFLFAVLKLAEIIIQLFGYLAFILDPMTQ